ncbi:MAG: MDR family MFS transporter [Desulfosporosinus sp.]|nr:MDR family MFS transporter [Desulfosporosinus sp.]
MTDEKELEFTDKQRVLIMMPLLIGGFIALLNETLLNVAFPQLMSTLHVSTSTVQWLGTAYMLIIGILVPVVAFLLKTFSTKKLYLTAMILFVVGTICCGFSELFPVLLIFRIVQGAGTGMLIPIMMNTILEIYPTDKRGAAMGTSVLVIVVAPAIGPTLSGLILQYLNWHWLFFLILPLALLAIILGMITLENVTTLTKPKIDVLSVVLSTLGFGGLIFGICSIENMGFLNSTVMVSLLCGIGGLILFSKRQFALKQPMLELRALQYPTFTLGAVLMFIAFMMPFAVGIILPTYTQSALGLTPFAAGLALLPGSILGGVITPLSGRLYDKIGARPLVIGGFAALTVAMFFLSQISASTNLIMLIILQTCMTFGISLIFTPTQTNSLNQLPKEYNAHGVAILNTMQQIAAAFGSSLFIGLMGTVQTKHLEKFKNPSISQQHAAIISGVDMAFTAALIIVVIGLILSFLIKRREISPYLNQSNLKKE